MNMTPKDYELIAAAIRAARYHANTGAPGLMPIADVDINMDYASAALANRLAADNPRFDRARFLKACGWTLNP
jgi:hypothetical protein